MIRALSLREFIDAAMECREASFGGYIAREPLIAIDAVDLFVLSEGIVLGYVYTTDDEGETRMAFSEQSSLNEVPNNAKYRNLLA